MSRSTAGKVGVYIVFFGHAFGFTVPPHSPIIAGGSITTTTTVTPSATATTPTTATGYDFLGAPWLRCGSIAAPDAASPVLPSFLSPAPWARSLLRANSVAGPRSGAPMVGMVTGDPWIPVGGETMRSSVNSRVDYSMLHGAPWARSALEATTTKCLGYFMNNSVGPRRDTRQPSGYIGGRLEGSSGAAATIEEVQRTTSSSSSSGNMLSSAPWTRSSPDIDGAATAAVASNLNGRGDNSVEYATLSDRRQDWQLLTEAPWFLSTISSNKEEQNRQRGECIGRPAGMGGQPDGVLGAPSPPRTAAAAASAVRGMLGGSPWNADNVDNIVAVAAQEKPERSASKETLQSGMLATAPWSKGDDGLSGEQLAHLDQVCVCMPSYTRQKCGALYS